MKVVEIRQEAELEALQASWETLLAGSVSNTVFLTWEWATAWWSSYGESGALRILAAFDENGILRGIAPLRSQTARKYGQAVPALTFVGDGSNDSDYLDFIIASGYEAEAMQSFQKHLAGQVDRDTVLLLNEVPATSPNLVELRKAAEEAKNLWTESEFPCSTVRLPDTWDSYIGTLRPRFRTKIRAVLRNLENRPEVRFGFCEDAEQVRRMLPILFDLHGRRWAQDGKPGVFGWDQKREFYYALSPLLLERGWLRFSWLEWNGQVLACQYGFTYGGTYFHLQEGYEPAAEHWNVGLGLRAWCIREFLKQGVREYDFLGGVGRHKTDWGAETKHSKRIQTCRATYKNIIFCRGPEWETRMRESVRNLLPESVLAARHARLERQNLAAFRASQNGHAHAPSSGSEWVRKAAAQCYLRAGLPGLARPLRERYQLSISSHGRWPRLSWHKRLEGSARIFYYHRINNEQDPFFPAMSTELFEQEMRFVARHHKVVSLSGMLDHLESGSREPVFTITFDDGYRDNYENAFPILQRYGLPATIFLTTGSIDAGEPLWFEQLAQAVKKTAREFVDVEIDLPRRFWMRTEAERVDSNNAIFRLLRGLADTERRQWLTEILRQLAAGDDGARNGKMLTWDQVRVMKAHGIDFGGHTVTHPFLSKMRREQAAWEVSECKRRIEQELQAPVYDFAYPNGREEDIGEGNKELIRSAGYRAAVTTIWGMNYRSTDPLELRRGQPWEENPALFAYKLDWYELVKEQV